MIDIIMTSMAEKGNAMKIVHLLKWNC